MKNVVIPSKADNGLLTKKLAPPSSEIVGPLPASPQSRTMVRNKITTCNSSASTSSLQHTTSHNKASDHRADVGTDNTNSLDFDNQNHDTENSVNSVLRRSVFDGADAVPIEIMETRFNHGLCPQCGLQIYHVNLPPKSSSSHRWLPKLFQRYEKENYGAPTTAQQVFEGITKNGLVVDGRCLLCYPIQQNCENEVKDPEISDMIQELLKNTGGGTTQRFEVEKYRESCLMRKTPKHMKDKNHPDTNNNAISTAGASGQLLQKRANFTTQVESPTDSQKSKSTCITTESNTGVARVPDNCETHRYQESSAKITTLLKAASNSGGTEASPTSKRKAAFLSKLKSTKDKKKPKHRADDIQNAIIYDLAGNEFGGAVTEGTAEKGRGVFASYFVSGKKNDSNDNDTNGRCKAVSIYEGYFENGLFHGYGIYRDMQGHVYEGEFECSKRHGFGKFNTTHGGIYTGTWCDNKFLG